MWSLVWLVAHVRMEVHARRVLSFSTTGNDTVERTVAMKK